MDDLTDLEQRIMNSLKHGSCLYTVQIAERLGVGRGSAMRALRGLMRRGLVTAWRPDSRDPSLKWASDGIAA